MAKIKTILLIVLGLLVVFLTLGLWDPFEIRKPKPEKDPLEEAEKAREQEKAKTNAKVYKDLADLGSVKSGNDRDNALQNMLDKDYPGSK